MTGWKSSGGEKERKKGFRQRQKEKKSKMEREKKLEW